jgi:uncharacterized protein YlxP (DUF503 family)
LIETPLDNEKNLFNLSWARTDASQDYQKVKVGHMTNASRNYQEVRDYLDTQVEQTPRLSKTLKLSRTTG